MVTKDFPLISFDETEARILPVLMYHVPKRSSFKEQLQWLKENQYTTVHLNEVSNYFHNPTSTPFPSDKKIVLTFDDAYEDFFINVCPLLKEFDFKATLCIPTGEIPHVKGEQQTPPKWAAGRGMLMTWEDIQKVKSLKTTRGENLIEFIPHSVSHRYFDEIEQLDEPENEFRREVRDSKKDLAAKLEIKIESIQFYCLPGGIGEGKEIVERILHEENYSGALRAEYKKGDGWNRYRIPRCEPYSKSDLIRLVVEDGFSC
jgi:peptidoglycan/xylan/chitin deacetylase (PgdA/CDA1 family)